MWMDEQTRELKERISGLSDDELLDIVEVEFNDYRKEAIDFAKSELTRRGIEFQIPDKVNQPFAGQTDSVEGAAVRLDQECCLTIKRLRYSSQIRTNTDLWKYMDVVNVGMYKWQ
jgi:hypothetical protein